MARITGYSPAGGDKASRAARRRLTRRTSLAALLGVAAIPFVVKTGLSADNRDDSVELAMEPAELLASSTSLKAGATIRIAGGHVYRVLSANAPMFDKAQAPRGYHLQTAGGAKLRVVSGPVLNFDAFAPDRTGAADVSHLLNMALSISPHVILNGGTYKASNIVVANARLEFRDGAKIVAVLGATDIAIDCKSGAVLTSPAVVISNSAMPAHGGFGCAIAIGSYTDISERVTGVQIKDALLTCINANHHGIGISILGYADGIRVDNTTLLGRFALGCQAHWGGVMDDPDKPHTSTVTQSRHPNNIRFDGITAKSFNGRVGYNVLSYAAAFDIHAANIVSHGWDRTFLVTPGDVYNFVSVPEEKNRVCAGMAIDGIRLIDPPGLSASQTGNSQMLVDGLSQTSRTAHDRVRAARPWDLTVRNVTIVRSSAKPFVGAPLVNLYYCTRVSFHVASISGFEGSASPLCSLRHTQQCDLTIDRAIPDMKSLIATEAAIASRVTINAA